MWSRILEILGRGYRSRAGAEAARRAFEAKYPEAEATDVWLRATEVERDVVAVLYRDRESTTVRRGMPAYRLFVVRPDLTSEELQDAAQSRYEIRGIK